MTLNQTICGHKDLNGSRDCDQPRWKIGATYCRLHEDEYREARRNRTSTGATRTRKARTPSFDNIRVAIDAVEGETVSDADLSHSHEYVPMPDLANLWHAVVVGSKTRPAANLLFVGPSGSGKTDGARYLAALVGLPFTKVDAASMTDPEAWFGTREIVVQDGVAVTDYRPSTFVEAIQKPGVTLIDEITRVRDEHRNVLLPLLDATRSVMNPLTGDVVNRHPQNFIIMAGNIGLHFTGTNAIDPAFLTRALTVEFSYIDSVTETRIVTDASGCDPESAAVFVRFAGETRAKAASDPEFLPISTRECIEAGRLVADGLSRDLAVKFVVLNAASSEGGSSSIRQELQNIWNGVRIVKAETIESEIQWTCPTHGVSKIIPAGISSKTGKAYKSFRACTMYGCPSTSDRTPSVVSTGISGKICNSCGMINPIGRHTFCVTCGATL